MEKTYNPTQKRLLVFTMPIRRRDAKTGLYTPRPRRGSMSRVGECWIYAVGPGVVYPFKRGQKAYTQDGFEFEKVNVDNEWEKCRDLKEFADLKKLQDDLDGDVQMEIVVESSILAVED